MRTLVLGVLLAACRTPSVAAPSVVNDVPVPAAERADDAALARWRALHLTGANWGQRLDDADLDDRTASAMARELLRAGNFACQDYDSEDECGYDYEELRPLDPDATFDDPCLRRVLALWALLHLGASDRAPLMDAFAAIVAMPEPERELQPAVFDAVGDDALRLRLLAVADRSLAEDRVADLDSDEAIRAAASELHLDAAVERLEEDRDANHDLLVAAATDPALRDDTRDTVLTTLEGDHRQDTIAALEAVAAGDDNCALAEQAAEQLDADGIADYLPSRPHSHDASAHMRAMCMILASQRPDVHARLLAWVGAHGMSDTSREWASQPDPADLDPTDADNDGETITFENDELVTRTHVDPADIDFSEDFFGYLFPYGGSWSCDSTGACTLTDTGASISFSVAGDSLVLDEISRPEPDDGCGC